MKKTLVILGIVALTLGTSGVVFASSDRPLVEASGCLHAFPHAVPDTWHVMGVMLSAAGSLQWYRDVVAPETDFASLVEEAADVKPGSEGLVFMPYLSGERTPHADPDLRGAFVGLTLRHDRPYLTRAVLEGVAYGIRDNFALMREVGLDAIDQVRVSGGGAKSRIWRQIFADVCGVELVTVNTTEGAAFGAALLAGVGAGVWSTVREACSTSVELGEGTSPETEAHAVYEESYQRFRRHYPTLAPLYRE